MIIYLDKNKKPNVVCDGNNILTNILEGDNITIDHNLQNKTITINSDAKNETINSIKAGDNIVIMDDGSGDVTVNTLIDILDKNPSNPKPGYMWILNNGGKNPGGTGENINTGSGSTDEETGGNVTIKKGSFACFDEIGNFYCSEDNGVSWQKRGKISEHDISPRIEIAAGNNKLVTAMTSQLYYSDDGGFTWKEGTQSIYSYVRSVKYINGKFYACCGNSVSYAAPAVLLVSDNGITWKTLLKKYDNSFYHFKNIQYINNKYFLTTRPGCKVLYSDNGISWKETTEMNLIPEVHYYNGNYIIVNDNTFVIYTSKDGISWTETHKSIRQEDTYILNKQLLYLCKTNGQLVALFYKTVENLNEKGEYENVSYIEYYVTNDGLTWSPGKETIWKDHIYTPRFYNNNFYVMKDNGELFIYDFDFQSNLVGQVPLINPEKGTISFSFL